MKYSPCLSLSAITAASFALASCGSFNKPLGGSDEFNPLNAPGAAPSVKKEDPYTPAITPGTFLQTVSPNTSFFTKFPKGNDQPAKTLRDGTDVKVVSTKGSYVKVEVMDTGEVGYVPSVMLGEKRSPNEVPVTSDAVEVPVIPETGEVLVTPDVAPAPEVPSDIPTIAPEPEIPGLEPPEIVDPSQPAE